MMPCDACGCACRAGGEAPKEEPEAPLLDIETGHGHTTAPPDVVEEMSERIGNRTGKFIIRGLLVLLWVYLFDSMKRYVINHTGGDTWFSMFVVIVIAVPLADLFFIVCQDLNEFNPRRT